MKKKLSLGLPLALLFCLGTLACNGLQAQGNAPLQGWWQVYLKHKTTKNWLWEADAGYRVHSSHFEPSTALARLGFGRQFKDFSVVVGAAWFETWPQNQQSPGTAEMRLHQKLTLPQRVGPLSLSHIYRAEERWFQQADRTTFKMQWRFRYQLQALYPFEKLHFLKSNPYLSGHSEIFLRPDHHVFSQYRLYGGAGLNWKNRWKLEIGYMAIWLPPKSGPNPEAGQAFRTILSYSW